MRSLPAAIRSASSAQRHRLRTFLTPHQCTSPAAPFHKNRSKPRRERRCWRIVQKASAGTRSGRPMHTLCGARRAAAKWSGSRSPTMIRRFGSRSRAFSRSVRKHNFRHAFRSWWRSLRTAVVCSSAAARADHRDEAFLRPRRRIIAGLREAIRVGPSAARLLGARPRTTSRS